MKKTSLKGPLYNYLGHFRQQKHIDAGHNTSWSPDSSYAKSLQPVAPPAPVPGPQNQVLNTGNGGQRFRYMNAAPTQEQWTAQQATGWQDNSPGKDLASAQTMPRVGPLKIT